MSDSNSMESLQIQDSVVPDDVNLNSTNHSTEEKKETLTTKSDEIDLGFSMRMDESQPRIGNTPAYLYLFDQTQRAKQSEFFSFWCALLFSSSLWRLFPSIKQKTFRMKRSILLCITQTVKEMEQKISRSNNIKFHDAARDSGGYAVRGYGLGIASLMLFVGGGHVALSQRFRCQVSLRWRWRWNHIGHYWQSFCQRGSRCTFGWSFITHLRNHRLFLRSVHVHVWRNSSPPVCSTPVPASHLYPENKVLSQNRCRGMSYSELG